MRMLNRALILCPLCTGAHGEAARELWRLGRRQQAVLEWRTVLARSPQELWRVFDIMAKAGAKPAELAALADQRNRHELSQHLLRVGMIDAARQVLTGSTDQENVDYHLVGAQIALEAKDLPAARAASQRALVAAPRDPRAILLAADLDLREGHRDQALARLAAGLRYEPGSAALHRQHLALLMETDRWGAIDSALDGFRRALGDSGAPMTEACVAAARIYQRRGQYARALAEYQAAAASAPNDLGLQLALGRAAEQAGSYSVAIGVYDAILRQSPGQPEASAALDRIRKRKKALEVVGGSTFD
jgi:tetratricopeptide (TPR) repeat protein